MRNLNMLPVGIENFGEIRTDGYYYVDKTAMICLAMP
ncbi:MAG: AAA family ATPase [Lachnospiraceae bacterium]|nr:AAA family ATPase [Lachnospiraceae bacterium]